MRQAAPDSHWAAVPSNALAARERYAEAVAAQPSLSWQVPFELALACSRSAFTPIAYARAARGELPDASALVTSSGRVLLATLAYPTGQVFLPLRVQLLERRR
jgi:hypothetical protein